MCRLKIACLVAFVLSGAAHAETYYVSPAGADANAGTLSNPWRSLSKALPSLRPGDTLNVRGGTYVERLKDIRISEGEPNKPITIQAYSGERPVLKGLLWLSRPSYWVIDGLNVTWDASTGKQTEHLVKLVNGVGWTFKNAEVWGAHSYACVLVAGTLAGEPSGWTVAHNVIHDTYPTNKPNQDQLMYINTGITAGPGLIERNLLYNAINGNGVKLGGANKEQGTANVTVRYNTIYNTSQSILVSWESRNNTIHHNLMAKVGGKYRNIRGYQLKGAKNSAYNNAGDSAKGMFLNDTGYIGVDDGGGNLCAVDPQFDSIGPGGFRPRNAQCLKYGAYAAGTEEPVVPAKAVQAKH